MMMAGPFKDTWDDEPPSRENRTRRQQPSLPLPPTKEEADRAYDGRVLLSASEMGNLEVRRGGGGASLEAMGSTRSHPAMAILPRPYERAMRMESSSKQRRMLVDDMEPSGKVYRDRYGREVPILVKRMPLPQKDHGLPKHSSHRLI